MQGFTDDPVTLASGDKLDVKDYISCLSEFIIECDTPMTIAIQGDWGSGKTSIMNMVKEQLNEKIVPVWFNTWQYSQFEMESTLTKSLLTNFLAKISLKDDITIKKLAQTVFGLSKTVMSSVVDIYAGGALSELSDKTLLNKNKPEENHADILNTLKERIQKAVDIKLSTDQKKRIVVFVDDLDRLAPEKAIELLEVLKNFMDVKQCVFVLAVDYAIITQGLIKKFGDQIGHNKGKSFFDKIIQLPFSVPTAQYDIGSYINELLKSVVKDAPKDAGDRYKALVNSSIGCNPRSLKRIFNSFILLNKVALKKNLISNKNNITDGIEDHHKQRVLFAILCLQTSFSDFYEYMSKNTYALDAKFFDAFIDGNNFVNNDKDENADEDDINHIHEFKKILKRDKSFKGDDDRNHYLDNICTFLYHFKGSLQLDTNDALSTDEIDNFKNLFKLSSITSNTRESTATNDNTINSKYKIYFLEFIKNKSKFFQNQNLKNNTQWMSSSKKVLNGLRVDLCTYSKSVRVDVFLFRNNIDKEKIIKILDERSYIEDKIGFGPFEWTERYAGKDDRLKISLPENYNLRIHNEKDWDEINNYFLVCLNNIYDTLEPYV